VKEKSGNNNFHSINIEGVICRLFHKDDLMEVSALMKVIKPDIAGLHSPKLYDAICADTLSDKRIVIVVAEKQSRLIGFNLTFIDRNQYWRLFIVKHPLFAFKIAAHRFLRLLKVSPEREMTHSVNPKDVNQYITTIPSGRLWRDSSPEIAKLVMTALLKEHRGRRISVGFGAYILDVLAHHNVRRVDTKIDPNNIPSIRLTYGLGFTIERTGDHLFATIDLDQR
jgi:hypothetical protein